MVAPPVQGGAALAVVAAADAIQPCAESRDGKTVAAGDGKSVEHGAGGDRIARRGLHGYHVLAVGALDRRHGLVDAVGVARVVVIAVAGQHGEMRHRIALGIAGFVAGKPAIHARRGADEERVGIAVGVVQALRHPDFPAIRLVQRGNHLHRMRPVGAVVDGGAGGGDTANVVRVLCPSRAAGADEQQAGQQQPKNVETGHDAIHVCSRTRKNVQGTAPGEMDKGFYA